MSDRQPFLTITNHHVPSCGEPPQLGDSRDGKRYLSYFENPHGEQFVFVRERDAPRATVYGGDIDWEKPIEVYERTEEEMVAEVGGKADRLERIREHVDPLVGTSVFLGEDELAWVRVCWRTSGAFIDGGLGRDKAHKLGYEAGYQNWHPDVDGHPNSADYRQRMTMIVAMTMFQAGQQGIPKSILDAVLKGMYEGLTAARKANGD